MSRRFEAAVILVVERLRARGLDVNAMTPSQYGGAAECSAGGFLVRVVDDRAFPYLTIAPPITTLGEEPDWYPVDGILAYLGHPIDPDTKDVVRTELDALEQSWDRVVELCSAWKAEKASVVAFLRKRLLESMKRNQ